MARLAEIGPGVVVGLLLILVIVALGPTLGPVSLLPPRIHTIEQHGHWYAVHVRVGAISWCLPKLVQP